MALAPETIAEIERIRAALPEARSALLPSLKAAQAAEARFSGLRHHIYPGYIVHQEWPGS